MARVTRPLSFAETMGTHVYLDNLETLLTAIAQRRMTREQVDRFARLLAAAERDALGRGRNAKTRD